MAALVAEHRLLLVTVNHIRLTCSPLANEAKKHAKQGCSPNFYCLNSYK